MCYNKLRFPKFEILKIEILKCVRNFIVYTIYCIFCTFFFVKNRCAIIMITCLTYLFPNSTQIIEVEFFHHF